VIREKQTLPNNRN